MNIKLEVVGLVVADMKATLDFYRLLGIEIPGEADKEGHVEAQLAGGFRLAFDTVEVMKSFDPGWSPPSGTPRIALAFLCSGPAEVDAKYAELTGLGYEAHKAPWDAFWGQRYAQVRDPDGNGVDLFAAL